METVIESAVIWVDQNTALADTLQTLKQTRQVAVDTESNSLYAYQEQVCLIQISAEGEDYVLDGLADIDLPALEQVFGDESIEKIFHAAEYDILCLKRDFGFSFHNLFDTMQAARILGYEKIGLSNLLEDLFGVDQGKSFQKANWGKRPLTDEMLYYARMDTHYLHTLRDFLYRKLVEKDLLDLAHEDFERLCRVEPNHKDTPCYATVSGYQHLEPQELSVLEALCLFRDKLARKYNRPLFKVIGNSALMAVARACPRSLAELRDTQGISIKLVERYADGLLEAVNTGLKTPPIHLKARKRPSSAYLNRLDAMKEWRKQAGLKMGVQSDIILPRDILEDIAGAKPANSEELQSLMAEIPWRYEHFGAEILTVVKQGK
ncbi:MAG: ribonuclease [Chloroflexota bacterium]|nr:ribonuclease [Chloroflexota bacterium]